MMPLTNNPGLKLQEFEFSLKLSVHPAATSFNDKRVRESGEEDEEKANCHCPNSCNGGNSKLKSS